MAGFMASLENQAAKIAEETESAAAAAASLQIAKKSSQPSVPRSKILSDIYKDREDLKSLEGYNSNAHYDGSSTTTNNGNLQASDYYLHGSSFQEQSTTADGLSTHYGGDTTDYDTTANVGSSSSFEEQSIHQHRNQASSLLQSQQQSDGLKPQVSKQQKTKQQTVSTAQIAGASTRRKSQSPPKAVKGLTSDVDFYVAQKAQERSLEQQKQVLEKVFKERQKQNLELVQDDSISDQKQTQAQKQQKMQQQANQQSLAGRMLGNESLEQKSTASVAKKVSEDAMQRTAPKTTQIAKQNREFEQIQLAQQQESHNLRKILSTPRTQKACRQLGILPDELQIRQLNEFASVSEGAERMRMRFNHHERKRQEKLKLVLEARSQIMADELEAGALGSGGSGDISSYSLKIMEDMLDKEAKNLEKKLRNEVRQHAAVEKENKMHLQKEREIAEKSEIRNIRRQIANEKKEQEIQRLKEHSNAKFENTKSMKHSLKEYEQARQAQILAMHFEDEVRIREFQAAKEAENRTKNDEWSMKRELIETKAKERSLESQIKAEEALLKYDEKITELERKKAEEIRQAALRSEENQLKVVDAVERRNQLERQNAHRRDIVGEQIQEQQVRVNTLLALKQQLAEQRRQRNLAKGAKSSAAKALNIKKFEPGPGSYDLASTLTKEGPKIPETNPSLALVEGSIDEQIKRSNAVPPPGIYDPLLLPTGQKTLTDKSIKIGERNNSNNFHSSILKAAQSLPGPGAYNVRKDATKESTKAPRIRPSVMEIPKDAPPSFVGKIDRETPGPADYAIDPLTRSKRLNKIGMTEKNTVKMLMGSKAILGR